MMMQKRKENMAKLYGPPLVLIHRYSRFKFGRCRVKPLERTERELYRQVKDHRLHYATYSVSRVGDASILFDEESASYSKIDGRDRPFSTHCSSHDGDTRYRSASQVALVMCYAAAQIKKFLLFLKGQFNLKYCLSYHTSIDAHFGC